MAEMGISGYFAEPQREPLCAVGSHRGPSVNAQICISVFSASIVPEQPRLGVILWKSNYTHDLVTASGTFAVTLLTAGQLNLFGPLGLETGRTADKLSGIEVGLTPSGDPFFPGSAGYLDCEVLADLDLGDSTLFIAGIRGDHDLGDSEPVTWARARSLLPHDVLDRYGAKFASDVKWSAERALWLPGSAARRKPRV